MQTSRIKAGRTEAGFTLIELMIVVAIIAIIAGVGIPKLLSAKLNANEAAAIATLRSISSAQAQIQSSSAVDTDGDGAGEFAYFGELAGTRPMRVCIAGVATAGTLGLDELTPPVLGTQFGTVDALGRVSRSGYLYAIFLPGPETGAGVAGIAESGGGGAPGTLPDPDTGEIYWCCYAWPVDHEGSGDRAFFVNQQGEILQCNNRGATPFDGNVNVPTFDECYQVAGSMSSGMNSGVPSVVSGQLWVPAHH